ncbi:MAG: AMP-binding protein [Pirellulaceae bacterium]
MNLNPLINGAFCNGHAGRTLVDVLTSQSRQFPDRMAFRFLEDDHESSTINYQELDQAARRIAAGLQQRFAPGSSVALVFPPGLDFIKSFLGCLYAGVLAIPATYPKPKRPSARLSAIVEDAQPQAMLATSRVVELIADSAVANQVGDRTWISSDDLEATDESTWRAPTLQANDVAFLQYTSGSTKDPRGVMVSHGNIMQNLEMIRQGFGLSHDPPKVGVCWLPAYHDMGLIGGILESLYIGGITVLMSPLSFLQRPSRWLQAISEHKAVVSGGPNFAYELCMRKIKPGEIEGIDLSSWQVAFSGAEPIRAATMRRFAETFAPYGFSNSAFYPCYGLAEATLLVAGGHGPGEIRTCAVEAEALQKQGRVVVAPNAADSSQADADVKHDKDEPLQNGLIEFVDCGGAPLDEELLIVDPQTCLPCGDNHVGEIWIRGKNVAQGYRNRPIDNAATFDGRLADSDEAGYLRSGDLGFTRNGSLFVTGRRKELLIIRGRNHYPHDLEATVQSSHPKLIPGGGSAFLVERNGDDQLVLVQEVDRGTQESELQEIIPEVRRNVTAEHDVFVHEVILLRMSSLPRTTSGKVRYADVKSQYLEGSLGVVARWSIDQHTTSKESDDRPGSLDAFAELATIRGMAESNDESVVAEELESVLTKWLRQEAASDDYDFDPDRPFADYGLDSLSSIELIAQLESSLELTLSPTIAWTYPTPASLARHLAELTCRRASVECCDSVDALKECHCRDQADPAENELDQLLAELEQMPEADVAAMLAAEESAEHRP